MNYTVTKLLDAAEVARYITSRSYWEWVGVAGYSDIPVAGGRRLPVAYTAGFADGREEISYAAGDVLSAVEAVGVGGCISIPDYSGCHFRGEETFTRLLNGFSSEYRFADESA